MDDVKSKPRVENQRQGWSRPVAVPGDMTGVSKETGIVRLPLHVFWSVPGRSWDLNDKRQRIQVYEIVLTEGTEDDVRRFIDVDELIRLWTDLWLPAHVRIAWSDHLRHSRGIELAC